MICWHCTENMVGQHCVQICCLCLPRGASRSGNCENCRTCRSNSTERAIIQHCPVFPRHLRVSTRSQNLCEIHLLRRRQFCGQGSAFDCFRTRSRHAREDEASISACIQQLGFIGARGARTKRNRNAHAGNTAEPTPRHRYYEPVSTARV